MPDGAGNARYLRARVLPIVVQYTMIYFTPDYAAFFRELAANNNRDWFQAHRARYENSVKRPFAALVGDLIAEMRLTDSYLTVEAKECIGRINRDVRFSADKTAYNVHYTAFISRGGRADKSVPGIYMRIAADELGVMGGSHAPSTEQLRLIRKRIAADPAAFRELVTAPAFAERFGEN